MSFKGVGCPGYRLPTEAEWEYAARANSSTATYEGDLTRRGDCDAPELAAIAWYCGNSDKTTHGVRGRKENGWGLYDMLGNVWEGTVDAAEFGATFQLVTETYDAAQWDPLSESGSRRVVRGCGWGNDVRRCRAAFRDADSPGDRSGGIGIRLVRTLP